jgi:hypothetical protein
MTDTNATGAAEREVGTHYVKSNAITAKLTGIDLQAFGYTYA